MADTNRLAAAIAAALGLAAPQALAVTAVLDSSVLASNNDLFATYANTCDPFDIGGTGSQCGDNGGALDSTQTLFIWGNQGDANNSSRDVTITGFTGSGTIQNPRGYQIESIRFEANGPVGHQFSIITTDDSGLHGQYIGRGMATTFYADAGQGSTGNDASINAAYNAPGGEGRVAVTVNGRTVTSASTISDDEVYAWPDADSATPTQTLATPSTSPLSWSDAPLFLTYDSTQGDSDPTPNAYDPLAVPPDTPIPADYAGAPFLLKGAFAYPEIYDGFFWVQKPIDHQLTLDGTATDRVVQIGDTLNLDFFVAEGIDPSNRTDDGSGGELIGPDLVIAPITVTLEAEGVGPVFDMSGAGVPGATVNLGALDPGDVALSTALTASNLFGQDLGDYTDLTLINIGLSGDSGFSLVGAPTDGTVVAGGSSLAAFQIRFDSTALLPGRLYSTTLTILTDEGQALGVNGNSFSWRFEARVNDETPVPAPGSLLLLGAGLVGLRSLRHRRA